MSFTLLFSTATLAQQKLSFEEFSKKMETIGISANNIDISDARGKISQKMQENFLFPVMAKCLIEFVDTHEIDTSKELMLDRITFVSSGDDYFYSLDVDFKGLRYSENAFSSVARYANLNGIDLSGDNYPEDEFGEIKEKYLDYAIATASQGCLDFMTVSYPNKNNPSQNFIEKVNAKHKLNLDYDINSAKRPLLGDLLGFLLPRAEQCIDKFLAQPGLDRNNVNIQKISFSNDDRDSAISFYGFNGELDLGMPYAYAQRDPSTLEELGKSYVNLCVQRLNEEHNL